MKLIIAYANVMGASNNSNVSITAAGCFMRLIQTIGGTTSVSPIASIPVRVDLFGVGGSESMFLPLSTGEGLTVVCSANVPSLFRALLSGYFVPLP
jgi:hypothetical protein